MRAYRGLIPVIVSFGTMMAGGACASLAPTAGDPFATWPRKRTVTPGSIEAALNPEFREHARRCNLLTSKPALLTDNNRSFVPDESVPQDQLTKAAEQAQIAGASVMWYIFTSEEAAQALPQSPSPLRIIQPNYDNAPQELVLPTDIRYSNRALLRSCSGYLAAAAGGSAGAPGVSAQASAEADRTQTSTITVIAGQFDSPLRLSLEGSGWPALYTRLSLWNLYQQVPSLIGNARYMREFRGFMLRRDEGVSMNARLAGAVAASVGPVSAKLRGAYENQENFNATSWLTIVESDLSNPSQRNQRFTAAPSLDDIQRRLASTVPIVGPTTVLTRYVHHEHSYIIAGMPASVCSKNWMVDEISTNVYDDTPHVTSVASVQQRGQAPNAEYIPVCTFTLSGMPDAKLFAANAAAVAEFAGRLRTVDPVTPQRVNDFLSVRLRNAALATTNEPVPSYSPGPYGALATANAGEGFFRPIWELTVDFAANTVVPIKTDPGRVVFVSGGTALACGISNHQVTTTALEQAGDRIQLRITTASPVREAEYERTTAGGEHCSYTVSVRVRLENGLNRDIPIALTLEWLKKKPAVQ